MSIVEAKQIIHHLEKSEKMKFLDEVWQDLYKEYDEDKVNESHSQIVKNRYDQYIKGELKSDSWENAQKLILSQYAARNS